jgi:hypothetical protein
VTLAGTVEPRQVDSTTSSSVETAPPLDPESREWLRSLRADGREHDEAVARLHALLLRAARFECARRRPALPHVRGNDLDDIANQAPTTRSSWSSRGWTAFAARAASPRGRTSSRCSRRP